MFLLQSRFKCTSKYLIYLVMETLGASIGTLVVLLVLVRGGTRGCSYYTSWHQSYSRDGRNVKPNRNQQTPPYHKNMTCHAIDSCLKFFFFPTFHLLYLPFFFSLPTSRSSDPGSHSRLFSPLPTAIRALPFLSREHFSSSLVGLRRTVLTHASRRRSQQLLLILFLL